MGGEPTCSQPANGCNMSGLPPPVQVYGHGDGCAVIGGAVYRGCRTPGYAGTYFYSDSCSSFVRSFRFAGGRVTEEHDWTASIGGGQLGSVASFGTDPDGEIYLVDLTRSIYQIVPAG